MIEWKAYAEREAASLLSGAGYARDMNVRPATYQTLVVLLSIAWLQGADFGSHRTLQHLDDAFDELRATL